MTAALALDPEQLVLQEKIEKLEELRRLELAKALERDPWEPYPHQIPPLELQTNAYVWLMLAGRGAGKTDSCASYFDTFMRQHPKARGGIIAPTLGDAVEACVYGPSGLMAHNPTVRLRQRAGGTHVVWTNGSEAKLFGAYTKEDVERLRAGGNRHLYWCEELAAWRNLKEAWENMELGLRQGVNPHIIASTTPKPRPKLKQLMNEPDTILSRASIHDNPKLPDITKRRLMHRYKGTRLEAQELEGEYIDDVEGALWTYEIIARNRVLPEDVPELVRVIVAVDPSGGDEDGNDEQGIIVAGRGTDGEYYVVDDRSCKLSPDGWARRAVTAYLDRSADRIIGETNFGGDMVISTIKTAAQKLDVNVATKKITASRGKQARAEPISALYEQDRVHHVGVFDELENQQRSWVPGANTKWSPDRMDALVFAITELQGGPSGKDAAITVPEGTFPVRTTDRRRTR